MKDKKMFALLMVLVVVVGVYAAMIMRDLKEVKNEIASFNVTMSEAKEEKEEAGKCGNPCQCLHSCRVRRGSKCQ